MTTFDRIKELSKKRNMTVQTVAEELGFSTNLFYKWKTTDPKAKDLQKVADYFNVSVDYLLGRDEPNKTDEIIDLTDTPIFAFDGKEVTQEERRMLEAVIMAHRANLKDGKK